MIGVGVWGLWLGFWGFWVRRGLIWGLSSCRLMVALALLDPKHGGLSQTSSVLEA